MMGTTTRENTTISPNTSTTTKKRKGKKKREEDALMVPFVTALGLLFLWVLVNYFSQNYLGAVIVDAAAPNNNNNLGGPAPASGDDSLITVDRLSHFIDSGTDYIARVSHTLTQDIEEREGKFTYIAYLDEDLRSDFITGDDQEEYNLLRHNGAIYSLCLSYLRTPSEEVMEAIQRSVSWLKKAAIQPVPDVSSRHKHRNKNEDTNDDEEEEDEGDDSVEEDNSNNTNTTEGDGIDYNLFKNKYTKFIPNLSAAWEDGTILGGDSAMQSTAKLGGAGLALIAMIGLEKISPGSLTLEELRQLANFIHYLQNEDGSFTCRYKPHRGGKDTSFVSLYYPGEAALGLVYLAELEDEDSIFRQRWIRVATKALLYLEEYRRHQDLRHVEPDHWALLATARLLPLLDSSSSDYWHVYRHAIKVMTSMVSVQSRHDLVSVHQGCHTGDGRTCPTSTRLEGLLAGLTFLKDDEMYLEEGPNAESLKERILYFVRHGADFVLQSMAMTSPHGMEGGVPGHFPPQSHRDNEVRIDYVQHSISAMMAYEKMLKHEGPYAFHSRKEHIQHVATKVQQRLKKVAKASQNKMEESPIFWIFILGAVASVMVLAGVSMIRNTKSQSKKNM